MARKKKLDDMADQVSELLELAQSLNMPSDWLYNELADETRVEAAERCEELSQAVLLDQLEYLLRRGWSVRCLRQVIESSVHGDE